MSKISYFIVRTFDVKHHAAHGTILINLMGKWTCLKQNGKEEQVKNIYNLTPHA
jgi:hypothetical protein